jgi:hypothetical protein
VRTVGRLQRSQLSVQALSRLSSAVVFLVAARVDERHLVLVALQGALFAIPYTLIEALVGRPLSADQVPPDWNVDRWARRAAAATILPVGLVCYLAASIALPQAAPVDRVLLLTPVLVQLPLEAAFWSLARTRSPRRANLVPQLTSVGSLLGTAVYAVAGLRMDLATLPAQLLVLGGVLVGPTGTGAVPAIRRSVRVGAAYCLAAGIDLLYVVVLPSVAGRLVGPPAIVVLRAMELAFGPFNVALSASVREDMIAGRASRLLTGTRALTVALLVAVSAVVIGSGRVRYLLAGDLAAAGLAAVALYCGYKAVTMVSTWLSVHHMIWARPQRFLVSAIGSRVLAFSGIAVSLAWVNRTSELFAQLLVAEALVVGWYWWRIRSTPVDVSSPVDGPARVAASDTL